MGAGRKVWLAYWGSKPSGGGTAPKKAVCLSDALVEQLTGCVLATLLPLSRASVQ